MFISEAFAQTAGAAGAEAASPYGSLIMMVGLFAVMYFVMIRPQMKRQKEQQKLIAALKTGDRVVTASGIHGLISNVKERTVILKIADNVKIEIEKSAIVTVANAEAAAK